MLDKNWLLVFLTIFSAYLISKAPNPRKKGSLRKQFLRRKQLLLVIKTKDNLVLKNHLKELRARDGLDQTQLTKLAKVSRQTISLLERNEYTPPVIIALCVAHISNEPVEDAFSLDEEGEKE